MNLKEQKQELRREIKERISLLSSRYCEQADQKIFDFAASLPEYMSSETIFCYVGTINEINTVPIINDAMRKGKRVGIPKCVDKGIMEVYHIKTLENLKYSSYGILEPSTDLDLIPPSEIDIAFIPCLACSTDCRRLGYGGGYYDRYLEFTKFPRAALCRGKLLTEQIPVDQHDQIMDFVISEKGIISITNRMQD
ncbi:5-formyltetrahydrofolate cyclo-ligase [Lacrimispora sp.]|jgi:5-formyltetrahydrofolate cyclo-ligase|uniref:5-formyltetrahydrofolate cyclo-ligase n=1 Tax=Lacrimispora sp. TaxID=2719234 RepID=UPI0028AFF1B5|nr:5-formyltetrahydrofolate cyclo-ligase [Lacrimispora sp.]